MSFTFSEIFNPAAPVASAPTTNPGVTPPVATPNPQDPFPKSATPDPVAQQTAPLEPFKDLFTVDPKATVADPNAPFITYDKAQLMEAASKMNFLEGEGVPELVEKATRGDGAALVTLINVATQQAYARGAELSAAASNRAAFGATERTANRLPEELRTTLASDAVKSLNPALAHPAMAPQTNQVLAAMTQKFPNATPTELAKMTNDYFAAAFQASQTRDNPNPAPSNPANPGSQDFGNFFGNGRRG